MYGNYLILKYSTYTIQNPTPSFFEGKSLFTEYLFTSHMTEF